MRIFVGLLAAIPFALGAHAQSPVFKCKSDGGAPIYQDSPCPEGRGLRDFSVDPPNVSVIPFARSRDVPPKAAERPPRASRTTSKAATRNGTPADAAERRHVKEGMTEGEVIAKLGAPDMQSGKRWTYLPAAGDPQTVTIVRFEDGRVRSVERRVLY